MIDPTAIQDQLTRALGSWGEKANAGALAPTDLLKVQGLRFTTGQKVLDTVTGREVEVIGGTRAIIAIPAPAGGAGEGRGGPG